VNHYIILFHRLIRFASLLIIYPGKIPVIVSPNPLVNCLVCSSKEPAFTIHLLSLTEHCLILCVFVGPLCLSVMV